MENTKKQVGSSSSFFTSEFFGTKESSISDVFASIFPPPKGVRTSSASTERTGSRQKQPFGNHTWNAKQDNMDKNRDGGYHNAANTERNSDFLGQRVEPSYLSSSLFYGGQEMYSQPPPYPHSSDSYSTFKKDAGEDDPSGVSRGNWWQGSLYY